MNAMQQPAPNHQSETFGSAPRHSISNARLFPRTTRRFRPASAPDNSACNSPIQQKSKPGPHRMGKRKRSEKRTQLD